MSKALFEQALKAEGITGQLADVARSIYQQESGSGKNAKTSNAGARGGMQVIPSTFKSVADKGWNIDDPMHNARAGIRYIKQMDKLSGGDPALTAAGYYGGPGGLEKARKGIAVSDPRNPNAPNTLEYGRKVASRLSGSKTQPSVLAMPDDQMPQLSSIPMAQAPMTAPVMAQAPAPVPVQPATINASIPAVAEQVAMASRPVPVDPWAALGRAMPEQAMRPADIDFESAMRSQQMNAMNNEEADMMQAQQAERTASLLKRFGLGQYSQDFERYQASVPEFTRPA